MLVFAIDDEKAMLDELHDAIVGALPGTQILDFQNGQDVLKTICEEQLRPDIVFSDIELPGMNGLSLAVKIKQEVPTARIVFVTAYEQYAYEAYRHHINGYVLKPVDSEQIREELRHLQKPFETPEHLLQVKCFGYFEVYWKGKPVIFDRIQTKELLAYLVDRDGGICTAEEICAVLWENETNLGAAKARVRTLIHDLRNTLQSFGMEQLLIRRRGQIGIRKEMVDCDYYRMLSGDMGAVNAFHGEYMKQYSWAEMTIGRLTFRE